ncbi:urea amidolyase associated protein UAAP1 [Microbacterium sp. SORGH_AS_0888]|uniref:urea amidolyase associated protein UAAP1 n=1 Tax=Microbacterium sp. SORGH_AS_0888 TaxID=3041791 RepID=UPI002786690E|nr:urea amidolyase associated protein UAAP1 [Microbacterium sp. SORGH_AS_0888]MDQ1129280.1 urea carboxylase-associated protein 2 [Microbacterium sp. SORGH_AS_0888]
MDGRTQALGDVGTARADARARATTSEWMPYLPPETAPFAPADLDAADLLWAETVAPGGYTHLRVARGTRIRLADPLGDASAAVLLFNAVEPWERLNVADTQKIPWQAYLGEGHPLLSGDGRVLATIVADTSGHHDAFCGTTSDAANMERYGDAAPEGPSPSGHGLLRVAGAKHGLTTRDLPPAVTFFQGVRVAGDGALEWLGSAGPGTVVELVAELPLIVLIANVPHPADPREDYVVGPLRVLAWRGRPTSETDALFTASPERERAYRNTLAYAALAGL